MELGCVLASRSINMLADIQAFLHAPPLMPPSHRHQRLQNTFFIITVVVFIGTPCVRDSWICNNLDFSICNDLELKVLNGLR